MFFSFSFFFSFLLFLSSLFLSSLSFFQWVQIAIDEGGYKRVCSNEACLSHSSIQNISHPRTDPVVIAAVLSKDHRRCLLGRSKK